MINTGKELKEAREKKAVSRVELARQCNVSANYLWYLETGRKQITTKMQKKFDQV